MSHLQLSGQTQIRHRVPGHDMLFCALFKGPVCKMGTGEILLFIYYTVKCIIICHCCRKSPRIHYVAFFHVGYLCHFMRLNSVNLQKLQEFAGI